MPYVTVEKQCEWCTRTWKPTRPTARACSPRCRALLTKSEKPSISPPPAPVQGFDFLDDDDFLTTVEAASLLDITVVTVRAWIDAGRLSASEGRRQGRGNLVQVRVGDVRNLLAQGHGAVARGVRGGS